MKVEKMLKPPVGPAVQDVPPPGGYKDFVIRGNRARRGPPGWALWLGVAAATAYGMYQLSVMNGYKRGNYKEKRECRMAVLPYLVAEQDIRKQAQYDADAATEAAIMKDVPGWEVGKNVYSKRWMEPTPGLAEMNSFANPQLSNQKKD